MFTARSSINWLHRIAAKECNESIFKLTSEGPSIMIVNLLEERLSKEEKDYYKEKALKISPEQRYQIKKHHWYFHESSYSMRGLEACDGQGCNGFTGCIPECRFYPEYGRIEDEEVLKRYE
jgi:hypothetical protein